MKKWAFLLILLSIGMLGSLIFLEFTRTKPVVKKPTQEPLNPPAPKPQEFQESSLLKTRQAMLAQLDHERNSSRTVAIPPPPKPILVPDVKSKPNPSPLDARAAGRKKRAGLPMGVVLWDQVPVYEFADERTELFTMMTGDMVRIFPDSTDQYLHIQPGLDVYLAATTKETKPAGERFPDRDGWVKKSDLRIFEPEDAKEYLMELSPVTLGNNPAFSSLGFYERAMKNPDPVVHRVVAPRLIALVSLHEDYSTSWSTLYRDHDPKIRSAALSALIDRGVANNREIIEDLIVRLTELTKTRAQDETEVEVLSLLSVLKASQHPRVPAALTSFKEAWASTQSDKLNSALQDILQTR